MHALKGRMNCGSMLNHTFVVVKEDAFKFVRCPFHIMAGVGYVVLSPLRSSIGIGPAHEHMITLHALPAAFARANSSTDPRRAKLFGFAKRRGM